MDLYYDLHFFTTYPGVLFLIPFILFLFIGFAGVIIGDDDVPRPPKR